LAGFWIGNILKTGKAYDRSVNAQQGLFTISDLDSNTPRIKNIRVVSTIDYQLED
jgi:hypothetical protein